MLRFEWVFNKIRSINLMSISKILCSEGKSCVQKSSGAVCEITSEIKEEIETPEKPSFNWKLWGIIIGLIGLIITIAKFILILTSSSRSP